MKSGAEFTSAPRKMADPIRVGFAGAGAIARCHAFALSALRHYYDDAPEVTPLLVTSARPERAREFAARFGFEAVDEAAFWSDPRLDAVFVLGPNRVHFEHARRALALPSVRRVYLEKPVCVTREETDAMAAWTVAAPVRVQIGFQLLQLPAVRRALEEWRSGALGAPVHFKLALLHSGYLDPEYRAGRAARLAPIPEGGAFVDLGSHLASLALAFLGPQLEVVDARAVGPFPDVDARSDLHGLAVLRDAASGAVGTLVASRIAAGHEDALEIELGGTRGAVRVGSHRPDALEICTQAGRQEWRTVHCGSDYGRSRFPARAAAAGWLRPLVHAHYVFFAAAADAAAPDMAHGLLVQRLLHQIADRLGAGILPLHAPALGGPHHQG
ncbi:MAG TPA: Gfo/Idh/MocA family oxidoreductase [Vicinamibacteria bacterium]